MVYDAAQSHGQVQLGDTPMRRLNPFQLASFVLIFGIMAVHFTVTPYMGVVANAVELFPSIGAERTIPAALLCLQSNCFEVSGYLTRMRSISTVLPTPERDLGLGCAHVLMLIRPATGKQGLFAAARISPLLATHACLCLKQQHPLLFYGSRTHCGAFTRTILTCTR